MDPDTGASTCALGSQECKKNIGNFTKKVRISIILIKKFLLNNIYVFI